MARGSPHSPRDSAISVDSPPPSDASHERLKALARLLNAYTFEATLDASMAVHFTWADDVFADIFGCDRTELNRRGWMTFVDPRDRAAGSDAFAAVALGKTVSLELRIVSATGTKRWLRMAAEPIRLTIDSPVIGLMGMAEDITERKTLIDELLEAVNREQRRIGNDLHDELGQVLTGASLLLRACHMRARDGRNNTPEDIDQVLRIVTGAIETTRLLAHGLAPVSLDRGGLLFALESLADRVRTWSNLVVDVRMTSGELAGFDLSTSEHLYRIVQEAFTNISKHAKARTVRLSTTTLARHVRISIADDGIGIPTAVSPGFGLLSMRYRAAMIGAQLSVAANPSGGTAVTITMPLMLSAD